MNTLLRKLESHLPWANLTGRHGMLKAKNPLPEETAGQDLSQIAGQGTTLDGDDFSKSTFFSAHFAAAHFKGVDFGQSTLHHGDFKGARFEDCDFSETQVHICDFEGGIFENSTLFDAQVAGANLRNGRLEHCDFRGTTFSLCDFFAANLSNIQAQNTRFLGVDGSFAHLNNVDFTGADLRGSQFSYATFEGVDLSQAQCQGADFRGVRGLDEKQRAYLLEQGARLRAGLLEEKLALTLKRLLPKATLERIDNLARFSSWAIQGSLILAMLAMTLIMFQARIVPENLPEAGPDETVILKHDPTDREIAQTQANLKQLREAIENAHTISGRYGVAAYPTLEDLTNNLFDRDGTAKGEDKVILVEGGLPQNLLTLGDAVLPYCNDVPNQETLSGDDSDWHYCPQTGRIFACGGFTEHTTLDW